MKYGIRALLTLLSVFFFLPAMAGKEAQLKKQLEDLNNILMAHEKDEANISYEYMEKSKELMRLEKISHELESQLAILQEKYRKESDIDYLEGQLDLQQEKLLEIAINFLYVPYEEYSIQDLAIPAFEKGSASGVSSETKYRGLMLKNYDKDWNNLKNFLVTHRNTTYSEAENVRDRLKHLPVYIQYAGGVNPNNGNIIPGFGDDWDSTYLGNIMYRLYKVLGEARGPEATRIIQEEFSSALDKMN